MLSFAKQSSNMPFEMSSQNNHFSNDIIFTISTWSEHMFNSKTSNVINFFFRFIFRYASSYCVYLFWSIQMRSQSKNENYDDWRHRNYAIAVACFCFVFFCYSQWLSIRSILNWKRKRTEFKIRTFPYEFVFCILVRSWLQTLGNSSRYIM